MTYLDEIVAALKMLGGEASLKDIYHVIEERDRLPDIHDNSDWQDAVHRTIQSHCSETEIYKDRKATNPDLFYPVNGLGQGIWRLREQEEYVWYACYGSNIQEERFARYLASCPDSSVPTAIRPYLLPYPLYFAGKSRTWNNHASAYIDPSRSGKTLGKAYKIKRAQFESVHRQEGRNYLRIIALGTLEGLPIYTFTHENVHENRGIPDPAYFAVILDGLKPLYPEHSEHQLGAYIVDAMLSPAELQVLATLRASEHKVSLAALKQISTVENSTIRSAVKNLLAYPLIKQDRRTIMFPFDDDEAAFYILENERAFIDRLITIKHEAEA